MIRLHPVPETDLRCPVCGTLLEAKGWLIPGMRALADLGCPKCGKAFYADLPAGHGLLYPALMEQGSAILHTPSDWFGEWLVRSYQSRSSNAVKFVVEERHPVKNPLLLNCLDALYGHSLLKLLNAQYYLDQHPEQDLIVMVPFWLRWLVPDGVAAIWTLDLPLRQGVEWNDGVALEISRRLASYQEVKLSVAFGCPQPEEVQIARFSRVTPFDMEAWNKVDRPVVTFIWREERCWTQPPATNFLSRQAQRVANNVIRTRRPTAQQAQRIRRLSRILKKRFPSLDVAVVGLGKSEKFPEWIKDMRVQTIDVKQEKAWCERYAQSHIVVGVHGSNMLLPSAHAGCTVLLMPPDRWSNQYQDILIAASDVRETLCRYHALPLESSPEAVAALMASLLEETPLMRLNFLRPYNDHIFVRHHPFAVSERRREIVVASAIFD